MGEGNEAEVSTISDGLVQATAEATAEVQWSWLSAELRQRLLSETRTTLEVALPALRRQIAEEIAVAIEELPQFHQAVDFRTYVPRADVVRIAREIGAH